VRDTSKPPRDVGLCDDLVDVVNGVLLDVFNLGEVLNSLEGGAAQIRSEALELAVAVDVVGPDPLDGVEERSVRRAIFELDDVAARDELGCARLDHRRREGEGKKGGQVEVMHGAECYVHGVDRWEWRDRSKAKATRR